MTTTMKMMMSQRFPRKKKAKANYHEGVPELMMAGPDLHEGGPEPLRKHGAPEFD